MSIACIACASAWAVALAALIALEHLANPPRWVTLTLVFLVVASFGACAAEDRVCALAERTQQ